MKKWMVTLAAVVAGVAIAVPAANATHGTATIVDAIDGTGPGIFFGNINNTTGDSADWYSFLGFAGSGVTIRVNTTSGVWFPVLTLYRSLVGAPAAGDDRNVDYTFLAIDEASGGSSAMLFVVLPVTGYYVVAVESFSGFGDVLGNYVLSIRGGGFACPPYPFMSPCRVGLSP
jgi:hypothetical protein